MDRVKFNPFSEILDADFNRQADYTNDAFMLFMRDFLTEDRAAVMGLEVKAQAVADMTVYVAPGRLYRAGRQGEIRQNSNPPLAVTAAHPNYIRVDRVCARYADVESDPETRNVMVDTVSRQVVQRTVMTRIAGTIEFMVVSGAPAPVPAAPAVPDGWVSLAQIRVRNAAREILQSDVLDERPTLAAYLVHRHTGGGDGARLDYRNLQYTPIWVIAGERMPTEQIAGGVWLDTSDEISGDSPVPQGMMVSAVVPLDTSMLWGDTNNVTKGGDAVEGGSVEMEIVVQRTEPMDKTKLWGLLNPEV